MISQSWITNRGPIILRRAVLESISLLTICSIAIAITGLRDEIKPADVAVVLGNTVDPDGQPSARLQARLDKTVQLYHQKVFPQAIVSGGVGAEGFDEAVVMKQYLVARGVPAARIYVDSSGANTYLTAQRTAELMTKHRWQSAIAISQYFHLPRTKLALQKFGVPTVYTAHANFFEPRDLYSTVREVFSCLFYELRAF